MSWLYVPGLEDLNSESASLSTISERAAASSLQWRGKPLLPAAWSRQWKRGGFITRLSGLICSPSMLDHGAASFISSLRAIPARTTALPESAPGPMATASSPPRSAALPKSAGLILSSVRTCRGTQTDSSAPSSRHWKGWATALRQEYSARPKPAIPCGASDCSSWPSARAEDAESSGRRQGRDISDTLTAAARDAVSQWPSPMAGSAGTEDYNAAGNSDFSRKAMELAEGVIERSMWPAPVTQDDNKTPEAHLAMKARMKGGPRNSITSLQVLVQDWMAPQVPNGGRSTTHAEQIGSSMYHNGKKVQMGLESQAKDWATPQARDHFPAHTPEYVAAKKAEGHGMRNLNDEAATWRAPSDISKRGGSQPMEKRAAGGHSVNLEDQAEHWMTPMTADTGEKVTHATKQYSLIQQAERDFTLPPSSPAPPIDAGPICSTDSPNTNQPSVRRKLNPIFVEALIRWPTGLSGFARPETAWTRWWQLMPSYLSALCSQGSEGPEQGSLF